MQRDQWCADTQQEIGGLGTHGTYVNLYINGLYWGMYNLGERPNDAYAAAYLGGQKGDYDTFNGGELKSGTTDAWNEMLSLAVAGITNEAAYSNLCHYLDVPGYIDYLLVNLYAGNQDWGPNWWAGGSVAHGVPFHFFSWDAEQTMLNVNKDATGIDFYPHVQLYEGLRQYPEFRRMFGDRAQRLLFNLGALSPERSAARWMQRSSEIELATMPESARWAMETNWSSYFFWEGNGSIPTHADWLQERDFLMTNWFPQRSGILLGQLRNVGMYPAVDPPVFTPHGGLIAESLAVTITTPPESVLYYTLDGSDPRLSDGSVSPGATVYEQGTPLVLTLNSESLLRARALATNTWSALVEASYLLASGVELKVSNISYLNDGSVRLDFLAWPELSYTLLAATNLSSVTTEHPSIGEGSAEWEAIATLIPFPDGTFSFVDIHATNYPVRFYRLTWP
jgi:hypothetical protein